jgi:Fe-S cluster assembly protein SufD
MHGAFAEEGGVLIVPKGVVVEKPIEVMNVLAGEKITVFPHLLIIAEDNSRLSFVNSYSSPSQDDSGLAVAAMELFVKQGAKVNFITVNDWSPNVAHFEVQRHLAAKDAEVKNLVTTLGSGFTRMNVEAVLGEQGAKSEMLGLWVGGDRQKFDHRTLQEHRAPNCHSNVLYKGALLDKARTIYAGLIQVDKVAQQTDAYQTNRNMVLSDDARADTIPMLEIEANDVRCSHGATVGQIEFEHLFYLMSRGIPPVEAEKLIVFGFFEEVLNEMPVPVVSEELRDRIGSNLIGVDYEQLSAARRLVATGK